MDIPASSNDMEEVDESTLSDHQREVISGLRKEGFPNLKIGRFGGEVLGYCEDPEFGFITVPL